MVTDIVPVEELRPRLWDPKFHRSFKTARDKQSLPILYEYTLSDGDCVGESIDENNSGNTEREIDKRLAQDL
ncbi:hypothetical protein BPOR_0015g00130 [Botrytis porri]|uniref:Uncharacterized protein n=2 Tax=Botrytis porri TaxID=87229 RepID=A0A4Z1L5Y8_9HELO|nr:hypothetical protein BPOR_0015g00130 [Botrytis porri]